MEARKIIIYDGVTNTKYEVNSASESWVDVIKEANMDLDMSKREATLRSQNTTLKLPNAKIPGGEQLILLSPAKQSSGSLEELTYTELRREAKGKEGYELLGSNPTKKQLIDILSKEVKQVKSTKLRKVKVEDIKKSAKESAPSLEEKVDMLLGVIQMNHKEYLEMFAHLLPKKTFMDQVITTNTSTVTTPINTNPNKLTAEEEYQKFLSEQNSNTTCSSNNQDLQEEYRKLMSEQGQDTQEDFDEDDEDSDDNTSWN